MSKRRMRSIEAVVTIDEVPLRWRLRSEPQWTTDGGYKGMTFSVEAVEGSVPFRISYAPVDST